MTNKLPLSCCHGGAWLLIELKSGDTDVVGWTYANTLGKFNNN